MARYDNPFATGYPTNPAVAGIGQSLVRALFGDPQLRMQQQLHDSQIVENEAQARNANSEADARNLPIKYQGTLADSILAYANAVHPQPTAPLVAPPDLATPVTPPGPGGGPIVVPPGFEGVARAIASALPAETGGPAPALVPAGGSVAPLAPVSAGPEQTQTQSPESLSAMAHLFQNLVQAGQGAHVPDFMGTIDAQAGNDETARRGFIGAGHEPGEWFALTPERRDEIARQGFDAQMAREQVQSADRRRGQDVAASTSRYSTDVGASTTRRGQDIGARTTERGQDISADTQRNTYPTRGERNNNPGNLEDGPFARAQPGYVGSDGRFARFNSNDAGVAAQENLLRHNYRGLTVRQIIEKYSRPRRLGGDNPDDAVENSIRYTAGRLGITENTVPADNQFADLAASMRDTENGHQDRPAVRGRTAAATRPPPRPRILSRPNVQEVDNEIANRLGASWGRISPSAQNHLRDLAMSNFQATGNPVAAVEQAVQTMLAVARGGGAPAAPAPAPAPAARPAVVAQNQPPVPGARRAPDGHWYVQRGSHFLRVETGG